jgi:hypothetical protein
MLVISSRIVREARCDNPAELMDDVSAPRGAVLLLVHGTGATAPEDEGDLWWQRGSYFSVDLERLVGRSVSCPEGQIFRWSGANSERARRQAALDLLAEWLLAFEREGRPYHLVGHSHGGSVIWEALVEATRQNKRLKHLASWSTVGTPFLHFGARSSDWLLLVPMSAVAALWPGILSRTAITWHYAHEILSDGQSRTLVAFALVCGLAALLFGHLAWCLGTALATRFNVPRRRRYENQAYAWYGSKWLGMWAHDDEAINGLKSVISFEVNVAPRALRWSEFSVRSFGDLLKSPFVLLGGPLYNLVVAGPTNAFISDRVARGLQGNDRRGVNLEAVGPAPARSVWIAPLPLDVGQELSDQADAHASKTLRKLRQALGMAVVDDSLSVVGRLTEQLTYQELVHTSYFDHPAVRQRVAAHITSLGAASEAVSPSEDRVADEIPTTWRTEPNRRAAFTVSAIWAGLLLIPILLVSLTMDRLFATVQSYTDEVNLAAVLESAPERNALEHDADAYQTQSDAVRDWVMALIASGRADQATAWASRGANSALRSEALLWVAAGLAEGKRVAETEAASKASGEETSDRETQVEYLIGRGKLDVALFMARLIPEGDDQRRSIERIVLAYAKKGDAAKAFALAAGMKNDFNGRIYADLVRALIESNALDQALTAARLVASDEVRADGLIRVARALRLVGRTADAATVAVEAIEAARRADDRPGISNPGLSLVWAFRRLVEAGFAREALIASSKLSFPRSPGRAGRAKELQQEALEEICAAAADAGMCVEALEAARRLTDPNVRQRALEKIVAAREEAGRSSSPGEKRSATIRPQVELEELRMWGDSVERDTRAAELAKRFAAVSDATGVQESVRLIVDAKAHDDALTAAIRLFLEKGGDAKAATRLANEARRAFGKVVAQITILDARPTFAGIGDLLHAAQSDTERLTRIGDRSWSVSRIAIQYARMGELRKARLLADDCLATDRLAAYSAILNGYTLKGASPQDEP